ncbi:MAG: hypothetical protein Q7U52_18820 [Hydrogenophaga sp.]|uniref:hypothetical protein n=1 Tax=Hydrogenophaga sp. TaxID=1904254 RepID=UPI002727F64B|nr:hypothetical protein [Hydrogenophaga sp.]MDO9149679.1 hypothetical protein [Hydrogenophaga sp.]MDO9603492.1 hypothetical protein [Hydrogenophaga sp.]MDP2166007.1 hypothetical protein [Hydrogenophaga sp.]MDP3477621.1 hypothetical protein [Hydrogenophaga sp.]
MDHPVAAQDADPTKLALEVKSGRITAHGVGTDDGARPFLQNPMTEQHAFIVRVRTVIPRNG